MKFMAVPQINSSLLAVLNLLLTLGVLLCAYIHHLRKYHGLISLLKLLGRGPRSHHHYHRFCEDFLAIALSEMQQIDRPANQQWC